MAATKFISLICLLLLISGTGCLTRQEWAAPAEFAVYPEEKPLKAVSPDGVVFRIKTEPNEPRAELSFWKEALKKRMLDVGYVFVREDDIAAGPNNGYLLELAAPMGVKDYAYLIAVFIDTQEDKLVVIESAGEIIRFNSRREDIVAAIQRVKW